MQRDAATNCKIYMKKYICRYEESIERNIELESKGDDNMRKIAECEAELRRAKDKLAETTVGC